MGVATLDGVTTLDGGSKRPSDSTESLRQGYD